MAKFFARTDYVMMLDVDFFICTDFRSRILNSPEIMSKLRDGSAAFVVPAFEYLKQEDGEDAKTFPADKQGLMQLVRGKKIDMFHKNWQPGHGATNYTRYYASNPGEVYRVHTYTHSYEPYVVYKREGTPYCDERCVAVSSTGLTAQVHRLRREQGRMPVRALPLRRQLLRPARRLPHPPVSSVRHRRGRLG